MHLYVPTLVTRINLMISSSNNPSSKIPPIKEIEIIHGRLLVGQPKKDKSKRHRDKGRTLDKNIVTV